jgi:N5-(cytidine 5'-diphosphoramidyl)-L-glutamine hydrolase
MKWIAVTQRVEIVPGYGERRDALDQRWTDFLRQAGLSPLLIPNNVASLPGMLEELPLSGVLLTGGGDLAQYGGQMPERDAVESALIRFAIERDLPLLGVCRGMQAVQHHFGVPLEPVSGHVAKEQTVIVEGRPQAVNSYHNFGARTTMPDLEVWGVAEDGVIEAVRHRRHAILGVMWHPERLSPFRAADIEMFRNTFGANRK